MFKQKAKFPGKADAGVCYLKQNDQNLSIASKNNLV